MAKQLLYLNDLLDLTAAQKTAIVKRVAERRGADRRAKGEEPSDKLLLSNARREVNSKLSNTFQKKARKSDKAFADIVQDTLKSEAVERFYTDIYDPSIQPVRGESNDGEFPSREEAMTYINESIAAVNESVDDDVSWRQAGTDPTPAVYELYQTVPLTEKETYEYGDKGVPKIETRMTITWAVSVLVYYQPSH